jgi:hypothetical protein
MLGYPLKFTGAIFQTVGAIYGMAGQQQFQSSSGEPQGLFPSGVNHHPLCYRDSTGRNRNISTFNFHETETAGGKGLAPFSNSAKVGDVDAIVQSCPQDLFAWGSSYCLTVNCQRNVFNFYQYSPSYPLTWGEDILGQKLPSQPRISSFRIAPALCQSSYQRLPF